MAGEWIRLVDAVHRARGAMTYLRLYHLALSNTVESRRQGNRWEVRRISLDRYLAAQSKAAQVR